MHTVPWLPKSLHLQTCQLLKSAKLKSEKKSAKIYWDKKWEWGVVGLAPHEAEFSRWFGKMDDSVYCTWCTFQGFSFSDKLYHWRNRLGVEIGMGITAYFFGAMTDTSRKVKDVSVICCRLHWEWSCGHFPTGRDSHGQTWLSGLPPASLSSTYQPFPFFLKYIFYILLFTVFLVVAYVLLCISSCSPHIV